MVHAALVSDLVVAVVVVFASIGVLVVLALVADHVVYD